MAACSAWTDCNYASMLLAPGGDAGDKCMLWPSLPTGSDLARPPAPQYCGSAQPFPPPPALLHTAWQKQVRAGAHPFVVVAGLPTSMQSRVPTCAYVLEGACHDAQQLCPLECVPNMGTDMGNAYATAMQFCESNTDCEVGFVVDASNQFYAMIPSTGSGSMTVVPGPSTCDMAAGTGACDTCTPTQFHNRYFTYLRASPLPSGRGLGVVVNGKEILLPSASNGATQPPPIPLVLVLVIVLSIAIIAAAIALIAAWRRPSHILTNAWRNAAS